MSDFEKLLMVLLTIISGGMLIFLLTGRLTLPWWPGRKITFRPKEDFKEPERRFFAVILLAALVVMWSAAWRMR